LDGVALERLGNAVEHLGELGVLRTVHQTPESESKQKMGAIRFCAPAHLRARLQQTICAFHGSVRSSDDVCFAPRDLRVVDDDGVGHLAHVAVNIDTQCNLHDITSGDFGGILGTRHYQITSTKSRAAPSLPRLEAKRSSRCC